MQAKIVNDDREHKRQWLHTVVPLDTPFTVSIEVSGNCNLKCNFCVHSLDKDTMQFHEHRFGLMSPETFATVLRQLKEFPNKIKQVVFSGMGEPLVNKNLPDYISALIEAEVAEKVMLITNGALLTHDVIDALVRADNQRGGVLTIKVSVNGCSADDFKKVAGVEIDFDNYMEQLRYLYTHKGRMQIYMKAMDGNLDYTGKTKDDFFRLFGEVCDKISVEHTVANKDFVDFKGNFDRGSYAQIDGIIPMDEALVCVGPFMRYVIFNNGDIYICGLFNFEFVPDSAELCENLLKTSLLEIWNGEKRRQFLKDILRKDFTGYARHCKTCIGRGCITLKEDYLDPYAEEILKRIIESEG